MRNAIRGNHLKICSSSGKLATKLCCFQGCFSFTFFLLKSVHHHRHIKDSIVSLDLYSVWIQFTVEYEFAGVQILPWFVFFNLSWKKERSNSQMALSQETNGTVIEAFKQPNYNSTLMTVPYQIVGSDCPVIPHFDGRIIIFFDKTLLFLAYIYIISLNNHSHPSINRTPRMIAPFGGDI